LATPPLPQAAAEIVGIYAENLADILEREGRARIFYIEPPLHLPKETTMPLALGEHVLLIAVDRLVEDRRQKSPRSVLGSSVTRCLGVL